MQAVVVFDQWTSHERALCARLSGASVELGPARIAVARSHGVHLLLADGLTNQERATEWGSELTRSLRVAAALETRRDDALREVLEAFGAAGVVPLLLKGAALAYTVYPQPWLRPRADVDLLVERGDRDRAEVMLQSLGWTRDPESNAEFASTQRHYSKAHTSGRAEYLDLHWKIANPPVFADALAYGELRARSLPVDALGPQARTLADGDALFLACIHIAAHHADHPRIIWLLDVHRLAQRLSPAEEDRFLTLTEQRGMRAVCRHVLEAAGRGFGDARAGTLAGRIAVDGSSELSARVLRPISRAGLLRADLAALVGWRARVRLICEHLFPSATYLRSTYPTWPSALLPIAAVHRIVVGAPKWLRSPKKQA